MKICGLSLLVLLATITVLPAQNNPNQPGDGAIVIDEAPADLKDAASRLWTAVFSPDGKTLAVAGGWNNPREPGELALWDVAGKKVRLIRRQEAAIRTVAFSADGKYLATGDFAGEVKVLDPATGKLIVSFPRHHDIVNSIAFTPDSETVVSSSFDGTIKFWDVATGKLTQGLSLENEKINSIAIAWHGARLAASTREGSVHVWNLLNRKKLYTIPVGKTIVETVVFAPDGKSLATGDWNAQLQLWETETGKKLREFKGNERLVANVAFSPDGRTLASGDADGKVRFFDVGTAEPTLSWKAHPVAVNGLGFSPDGKLLATASHVRGPKIWDLKTPNLSSELENVVRAPRTLLDMLDFTITGPPQDSVVDQPATFLLTVRNKTKELAADISMKGIVAESITEQDEANGDKTGKPKVAKLKLAGVQSMSDWPKFSLKAGESRALPLSATVKKAGKYQVRFYLEGDLVGSALLTVVPAPRKANIVKSSEIIWVEVKQPRLVRLRSGLKINSASLEDDKVARALEGDHSGCIQIIGAKVGKTWLTLTDENGDMEIREVRTVDVVPGDENIVDMIVGQSKVMSMKTKDRITFISNINPSVATTHYIAGNTSKFTVTAVAAGWAGLILKDENGNQEIMEIRVKNPEAKNPERKNPKAMSPTKAPLGAAALAARIDQLIDAEQLAHGIAPAPLADDAEFMRRLYLDLTGRIPSVAEARGFLADKSPDRRARLIDSLLDNPRYALHFGNTWRVLMLAPPGNPQAASWPGFKMWLDRQFQQNVAYDKIVRDLLTAEVANANKNAWQITNDSPSAYFYANDLKAENVAASTSRVFLGVRLECAQCHNHPTARWTRQQFWEFAAFFDTTQNGHAITIPATGKVVQASFLDGKAPQWTNAAGSRATLADWVTAPDNPYFARTAANRLWAHFFGIGIIDPLDDEPADDNPASHPKLLTELSDHFVASKYDIKNLIRAITLSKTYQRTAVVSAISRKEMAQHARRFSSMPVRGMTGEQLYDSVALATGYVEPPQTQNQQNAGLEPKTPRSEFLALFAALEKTTETRTSILQMLALMNGEIVADATSLERGKVLAELVNNDKLSTAERIETLYLATLSRLPRADEASRLLAYVNRGRSDGERRAALADIFWALLNSPEFFFNH